jgi:hypothetical protein
MKFLLMMNAPRGDGDWDVKSWPHADLVAHIQFMKQLGQDFQREGVLAGAEGLAPPGEARLVRAGKDGAPITDGPFAETKEFLAGFWVVDVETPEQAYALAARVSLAPGPGGTPLGMGVEVRQVMSAPPVEV